MEDSEETQEKSPQQNEDSQDSQEDILDSIVITFSFLLKRLLSKNLIHVYYDLQGVSKWERMEAEDKLG